MIFTNCLADASLEWEEIIPWLKENTKMQIWLKGGKHPIFYILTSFAGSLVNVIPVLKV